MGAFIVLLTGCTGWIDQEPACDEDVYAWSDDLLAYILTGDGSGSFDFDPADEPRVGIEGEYDAESGDFAYEVAYDRDYWLAEEAVEGWGTVYHDGDLDLYYVVRSEDVLGETWATDHRVERQGCDMAVWTWDHDADPADALLRFGAYDDDAYTWTAEDTSGAYGGTLEDDLTRTGWWVSTDGGSEYELTEDPDGTAEYTYLYSGDGATDQGSGARAFDGGWVVEGAYESRETEYTYRWEVDYAGDGVAEFDFDGDVIACDVDQDGDECTMSCDDGNEYAC